MASARNINGLTQKQQVFADLFRASDDPAIRDNAKRCYMIAFDAKAKSAEANGPRLLKDKHVAEYLKTKAEMTMDKFDISEERIVQEIACTAFLDPADFYDEDGRLLHIRSMPEHARRVLAGMDIYVEYEGKGNEREAVGYTNKIKYSDKKSSLELLMKYKGMLKQEVEHTGNIGGVLLVPTDVDAAEWQAQHFPQTAQSNS